MERHFNNRDFEKLLRDNANQYRMYPSEKVWKNVNAALHTRRKWYGISAVALLLITSAFISSVILNNISNKGKTVEARNILPAANATTELSASSEEKIKLQASITESPEKITEKIIEPVKPSFANNKPNSYNINIVSSETKINTPQNDFQFEKISDKAQLNETNSTIEKETLSANPLTTLAEERNENFTKMNPGAELSNEEKITEAIAALASQNIPIVVSKKQPRITAQFYFTPTISYRKLSENKRPYSNGLFLSTQVIDLNNLVKHKPAMGFEFGVQGKYRLNDKLSFKSGFQFNINRYDIRAYSHPTEIATVAISSGLRTDYLASLSNYRNFSGTTANWLENFYFQAALPVGAEIILGQKKNFNWGISGTIQPTYVIGDRAYMISSDYKNYAKFPDLMRRWNISTGLETFVSYSTGKINWQAGPHLRYQHLSSFVSGYPVKENLFAVGLSVGATINKK